MQDLLRHFNVDTLAGLFLTQSNFLAPLPPNSLQSLCADVAVGENLDTLHGQSKVFSEAFDTAQECVWARYFLPFWKVLSDHCS